MLDATACAFSEWVPKMSSANASEPARDEFLRQAEVLLSCSQIEAVGSCATDGKMRMNHEVTSNAMPAPYALKANPQGTWTCKISKLCLCMHSRMIAASVALLHAVLCCMEHALLTSVD